MRVEGAVSMEAALIFVIFFIGSVLFNCIVICMNLLVLSREAMYILKIDGFLKYALSIAFQIKLLFL